VVEINKTAACSFVNDELVIAFTKCAYYVLTFVYFVIILVLE